MEKSCSMIYLIEETEMRGVYMRVGFIVSLIIALLVSIFAIQNAQAISINFLFAKVNVSLAIIIILSVIVGAVIVTAIGLKREINSKKLLKNQKAELEKMRAENEMMKNKLDSFSAGENTETKEACADKEENNNMGK